MSEQEKPVRKYLGYPAVIDWLQWSEEFEERIDKPYMPQMALTLIAEMRKDLKSSVPLEVVQELVEALRTASEPSFFIEDEYGDSRFHFYGENDFFRKALLKFEEWQRGRNEV